MLDKKLYRDVSDLLELNVDDEKVIRILMVRGYTTEQVKRTIREIRDKGDIQKKSKSDSPIKEVIETSPSKRFSMFGKIVGKKASEEELIQKEVEKITKEEELMIKQAQTIHKELQEDLERAAEVPHAPEDIKEVLLIMDRLLEKLDDQAVLNFAKSKSFDKYKQVMEKYLGKKVVKRTK
jgi:SOS response regulatory protein OraA/RecX